MYFMNITHLQIIQESSYHFQNGGIKTYWWLSARQWYLHWRHCTGRLPGTNLRKLCFSADGTQIWIDYALSRSIRRFACCPQICHDSCLVPSLYPCQASPFAVSGCQSRLSCYEKTRDHCSSPRLPLSTNPVIKCRYLVNHTGINLYIWGSVLAQLSHVLCSVIMCLLTSWWTNIVRRLIKCSFPT